MIISKPPHSVTGCSLPRARKSQIANAHYEQVRYRPKNPSGRGKYSRPARIAAVTRLTVASSSKLVGFRVASLGDRQHTNVAKKTMSNIGIARIAAVDGNLHETRSTRASDKCRERAQHYHGRPPRRCRGRSYDAVGMPAGDERYLCDEEYDPRRKHCAVYVEERLGRAKASRGTAVAGRSFARSRR